MNYIIFDLEFNQAYKKNKMDLSCPFEIIQIGAIKLDSDFNEISTFSSLIKPKIYKELHPFVQELTKIDSDTLCNAKPFKKVFGKFLKFIRDDDVFVVWGLTDMKELFRNIEYHKQDINLISKKYINIQQYASKYLHSPKGKNVGLRNAVELLDIPLERDFHDALNDAFYTSKIFIKIYNENIKPLIYNPDEIKPINKQRERTPKKKIDVNGLIKQFEKMHDRKMSEEEKSMILLSYKMGLTEQFQIEKDNK